MQMPTPEQRVTVPLISSYKSLGRKISAITAYDFTMATLLDRAGVDLILVGDSLGCVVKGEPNTLSVTLEEMIYHTRCVARATQRALLVADMPFMTYQISEEDALRNAGCLIQAGAAAVKLEGGIYIANTIARLTQIDIPVMGHVGLTPQSYHRMGGHKLQGRGAGAANSNAGSAERILADALAIEEAGAFAVVIEGVPAALAAQITKSLRIPTIGIAAGAACDGQIIVSTDLLGLNPDYCPAFVKPMTQLGEQIIAAVRVFHDSVCGDRVNSHNKQEEKLYV